MKTSVLGIDGKAKHQIQLPECFSAEIRPDLIQRAIRCNRYARSQPQGRDPDAGKRNTAESWGTGYARARVPRLKGSGYPSARNAGFAPMTIGGRITHPPKSEKNLDRKINAKEKKLAFQAAVAATADKNLVTKRGHMCGEETQFPLIVDDKIQNLEKTKYVKEFLEKIALWSDVIRVKRGRKIRAGKGKRRNRKYKRKKGPLFVIGEDYGIYKSARNIPGVDVINIEQLTTEDLAPGSFPGRLVIWSESSLKKLEK